MKTSEELSALHKKHVLTPWMAQGALNPPVMVRGEGRHLFDGDGKRYLDFGSGLVAVNLGHGHPKVVAAMQKQAATLCYSAPSLFHDARALLAKALSDLSPWPEGARVFFTTAGAEANDDVVRMARALTGRQKVLTAYRSFHGSTGTAIHLTGEDRRFHGESGSASGIVHFFAPYPYRSPFFTEDPKEECERAISHFEKVLVHEDPSRVAAVLIEPVVGSNGVIVYPEGYLARLRELTAKHGILLVFDEVMTGFGRTGSAFAAETFSVIPDLITFAKGVTSAYVPLGGVMMKESLAKHFDERPLPCGHTYAGHPLSMATALAVLEVYREEKLFARAKEIEGWLRAGLGELVKKHRIVGDARGVGAFFALELVKDKASREPLVPWHGGGLGVMAKLYAELRSRGVYTFGKFNIAMMTPPLTITKAEIDEALLALDASLAVVAASL